MRRLDPQLFVRGMPPQASYLFKHALLRDAAHESLLHQSHEALHIAVNDSEE